MEEPFKINHKIQAREVRLVGENVAHCPTCYNAVTPGTIDQLTREWMDSPEHRRNLLAPEFDSFGFGTATDDELGLYAVHDDRSV